MGYKNFVCYACLFLSNRNFIIFLRKLQTDWKDDNLAGAGFPSWYDIRIFYFSNFELGLYTRAELKKIYGKPKTVKKNLACRISLESSLSIFFE